MCAILPRKPIPVNCIRRVILPLSTWIDVSRTNDVGLQLDKTSSFCSHTPKYPKSKRKSKKSPFSLSVEEIGKSSSVWSRRRRCSRCIRWSRLHRMSQWSLDFCKKRDSRFALYIHHGGSFTTINQDEFYVGGTAIPVYDLNSNKFNYLDVVGEVKKLGYDTWSGISYKVPNTFRYKHIDRDEDVVEMLDNLNLHIRVLHVFVDRGKLVGQGHDGGQIIDDEPLKEADWGHNMEINGKGGVDERWCGTQSKDSDYIPFESEDYNDTGMDDDELCSDEEYVEARRALRDKSITGLCDEIFSAVEVECGLSNYEISDGDANSNETKEDDESMLKRRLKKGPVYDQSCDHMHLKLEKGMRFEDGYEARDAVKAYAIEDGRGIHFRNVRKT